MGQARPFREINRTTKKARREGADVEPHHLIERRHFDNGPLQGNPNDFAGVMLPTHEHQQITNALRAKLGYTGRAHAPAEIYRAHKEVYKELGRSDWWQAIEPDLRRLTGQ